MGLLIFTFGILWVVFSILFVIGLINPSLVIQGKATKTRGKVFLYYGLGAICCFLLMGISLEGSHMDGIAIFSQSSSPIRITGIAQITSLDAFKEFIMDDQEYKDWLLIDQKAGSFKNTKVWLIGFLEAEDKLYEKYGLDKKDSDYILLEEIKSGQRDNSFTSEPGADKGNRELVRNGLNKLRVSLWRMAFKHHYRNTEATLLDQGKKDKFASIAQAANRTSSKHSPAGAADYWSTDVYSDNGKSMNFTIASDRSGAVGSVSFPINTAAVPSPSGASKEEQSEAYYKATVNALSNPASWVNPLLDLVYTDPAQKAIVMKKMKELASYSQSDFLKAARSEQPNSWEIPFANGNTKGAIVSASGNISIKIASNTTALIDEIDSKFILPNQ